MPTYRNTGRRYRPSILMGSNRVHTGAQQQSDWNTRFQPYYQQWISEADGTGVGVWKRLQLNQIAPTQNTINTGFLNDLFNYRPFTNEPLASFTLGVYPEGQFPSWMPTSWYGGQATNPSKNAFDFTVSAAVSWYKDMLDRIGDWIAGNPFVFNFMLNESTAVAGKDVNAHHAGFREVAQYAVTAITDAIILIAHVPVISQEFNDSRYGVFLADPKIGSNGCLNGGQNFPSYNCSWVPELGQKHNSTVQNPPGGQNRVFMISGEANGWDLNGNWNIANPWGNTFPGSAPQGSGSRLHPMTWAWFYSSSPRATGAKADSGLGRSGPDPAGLVPADYLVYITSSNAKFDGISVADWDNAFRTFGGAGTRAIPALPWDWQGSTVDKGLGSKQTGRYQPVTFSIIDFSHPASDLYDTGDYAVFTHADSATQITNYFYYVGNSEHRIKFTPTKVGTWTFIVYSTYEGFNARYGTVECVLNNRPGFLVNEAGNTQTVADSQGCSNLSSPIWCEDWNSRALGLMTNSDRSAWGWNWGNIAFDHATVIEGANAYAGRSLQVFFPQGWNTSGRGIQFGRTFGASYTEVYYSFRIMFQPGFAFNRTGKLGGVGGGAYNAGQNKPNGTDGFSVRTIWRVEGSLNKCTSYIYHPDQATINGDDFDWDLDGTTRTFTPGVWHHVETRVKINTPGAYDGIVQCWFDGDFVFDKQDFRFRTVSSWAIDAFRLEAFFGGNTADWGPFKDEYCYYDNIVISTSRVGPNGMKSAVFPGSGGKFKWSNRPGEAFSPQLIQSNLVSDGEISETILSPTGWSAELQQWATTHKVRGISIYSVAGHLFHQGNDIISGSENNPSEDMFSDLEDFIEAAYQLGMMVHLWLWGAQSKGMTPINLPGGVNGAVDRKLQRIIAARLGPHPGLSIGYGTNVYEWATALEVASWRNYMASRIDASYYQFLGAQAGGPIVGTNHSQFNGWNDSLDYGGYTHHSPTYSVYKSAVRNYDKPAFSEGRAHVRAVNEWDWTETQAYRSLWQATIAGGCAQILIYQNTAGASSSLSLSFPQPGRFRTFDNFWHGYTHRFTEGMYADDSMVIGNQYACHDTAFEHAVIYQESTNQVVLDLSNMAGTYKVVRVRASTTTYQEADLGNYAPGTHTFGALGTNDWAFAIGDAFPTSGTPTTTATSTATTTATATATATAPSVTTTAGPYRSTLSVRTYNLDIGSVFPTSPMKKVLHVYSARPVIAADDVTDTVAPSAPIIYDATALSNTSINLSWTTSTDQHSGIDKYTVYANNVPVTATQSTSATLNSLTEDTQYIIFVRVSDNVGNTQDSNPVGLRTPIDTTLETPGLEGSSTGTDVIYVKWTDKSKAKNIKYRVYLNGAIVKTTTKKRTALTGLDSGKAYQVVVQSYTDDGDFSDLSEPISVSTDKKGKLVVWTQLVDKSF